ncbi:Uncharacterized protein dnm_043770 [Desulfonema magnum]|uniref:Uncharacterized protein n=1 Tax=Desulfonema magnum TaxID=45655 RepID=A0A975GP07_9BACT|nr:Uncharacterized protein dnm_043770 [Desulfonema magnum]
MIQRVKKFSSTFRTLPKNYIFAAAKKHFSHSGENPGKLA